MRILVSPLDWGLGHAARMIPVIAYLIARKQEVFISSYGESHEFLKKEFPALQHIHHPGISVTYPVDGKMTSHLLKQLPSLIFQLRREKTYTSKLVERIRPDLILSDNRYGVYSPDVYSIFITHQTKIKTPNFNRLVNAVNHNLIHRFNECWIPDDPFGKFSGTLSDAAALKIKYNYMGCLSTVEDQADSKVYDYCFIISGPEPQRTLFAEKVNEVLKQIADRKVIIITAIEYDFTNRSAHHEVLYKAGRGYASSQILSSSVVVSRPGYSTIMDLAGTGIKALFIPTPGQTEQEYLAEKLHRENISACVFQDQFTADSLSLINDTRGFDKPADKRIFEREIDRVLTFLERKRKH